MTRAGSDDVGQWLQLAPQCGFRATQLAAQLKVTPRHFRRRAHKVLGQSPQDWLDQQRLSRAAHLLKETRLVKAVAFALGFKQPSHFSRKFKRHYGLSPIAFLGCCDHQTQNPQSVPPIDAHDIENVRAGYAMSGADTPPQLRSLGKPISL